MSILIINQTTDKTFYFTLKDKPFTLEPGTKNIIDSDICPEGLSKFRATGEIFINHISPNALDFYKALSVAAAKGKEDVVEDIVEVVVEDVVEDVKPQKKTKGNEK